MNEILQQRIESVRAEQKQLPQAVRFLDEQVGGGV